MGIFIPRKKYSVAKHTEYILTGVGDHLRAQYTNLLTPHVGQNVAEFLLYIFKRIRRHPPLRQPPSTHSHQHRPRCFLRQRSNRRSASPFLSPRAVFTSFYLFSGGDGKRESGEEVRDEPGVMLLFANPVLVPL